MISNLIPLEGEPLDAWAVALYSCLNMADDLEGGAVMWVKEAEANMLPRVTNK